MGVGRSIGNVVVPRLAPRVAGLAPGMTASFVREALHRALDGGGPFPSAAQAAEKQLQEQHGDVEKAVREVVENNTAWAGAQGFVTNLGGLVTAAVAMPVNITGLTVLQCRMVGGIAHLRGYDLDDRRVHNAILVTVLGEDTVDKLVAKQTLPAPPMALATAPFHDPALDPVVSREVATDLISRVAGKRLAGSVARRVPVVGGVVGLGTDALVTWRIGRYAIRELRPRHAPERR